MSQLPKCSSCGNEIEPDVPFRQCPKCLLGLGFWREDRVEPAGASATFPAEAERLALPDYEILGRIGRGGMGVVYEARQLSLNRIIALKVILGGELASPAALARFRREAEAVAKLDHPNIVAIYEVGEHEATPFLVMRFVEGASLAERLGEFALGQRAGRVQSSRRQRGIARLMATVARAVHYAHGRGVLHRDLKPSNILIDREARPHLTDFGVAKLVDEAPGLTQTAELLGTPSYMSPEQAAGRPLCVRADVYGLGVILYELLTGRRPFEAERPIEVLRLVLDSDPVHPRVINGCVDPDLATICLKCLDKEPARRYGSALKVAEDLERWQRREPILARPAGPALLLRRWTARNPALATLLAGLLVGMGVTLGLLAKAREEQSRKSVALAILRTEAARQLQEIWDSPSGFFAIKSETLLAMAGSEPTRLQPGANRFTIAFVAQGNPLDRVLGAAPLLEHMERSMTMSAGVPTRMDLRLYKTQAQAAAGLVDGKVDLLQMNVREYLRAKAQAPGIQPLASLVPLPGPVGGANESAVIFARADSGIRTVADLRARSFLFGPADSTLTFWAKVWLAEAGIHAHDLSVYRYVDAPDERSDGFPRGPLSVPTMGNPFSEMTPVEAVLDGVYDAALATERRFTQVAVREKLVLLKRFEDTRALLVGRSALPAPIAAAFQRALLNLKDTHVLQSFPSYPSRFEACSDGEFGAMRNKLAAEASFDEDSMLDKELPDRAGPPEGPVQK